MGPTVLRPSFGAILQAVEMRLVAKGVVPDATLVKWLPVGADVPTLDANLDALMVCRGGSMPPVSSWQTGAGRFGTIISRRLDIWPRTRLMLDAPDRVKVWLLGAAGDGGYIPTEEAVMAAMTLWTPLDAYGNHLTACDLHLLSSTDPVKGGKSGKAAAGFGWGSVSFEVKYLAPLPQNFS